MKRQVARCTLILTFSLALLAGLASTSEACLFPGLFGPGCGCWGSAYRPYYPPVYAPPCCPPTQTFYGPVYSPCRPLCAPCGPVYCPCGPAICPSSPCGTNLQAQPDVKKGDGWQPSEAAPKTFADDEKGMEKEPVPESDLKKEPAPEAGGEKKSTDPFDFPAEKSKPAPPLPGETEVKKPVSPAPPTVIEQKKPAPAALPIDEDGQENSKSDGGEKNEKKTPEETKESGANPQLRVPPLNLDEKITWRSTPERTRLILRATFRSPRIVRKSVQPDTQQTPVSWGAEVARN